MDAPSSSAKFHECVLRVSRSATGFSGKLSVLLPPSLRSLSSQSPLSRSEVSLTSTRLLSKLRTFKQQALEFILQRDRSVVRGGLLRQRGQQFIQNVLHALLLDPDASGFEHSYEFDFRWRQEDRGRTGGTGSRCSTDSMHVVPR